jgi:hypothetical protein
MTNKHFFEEEDYTNEITIKNGKYNMKGKLIFMPKNIIDIAIIELVDKKYLCELEPIKIKNNKINLLQEVYAVNYSYFDITDILKINKPFVFVIYVKLERCYHKNIKVR